MNMDLYEIWKELVKISDGLMENKIEFSCDALMGVMGTCHPSDALDRILTNIDWDTSSPDTDMLTEALDELVEFNDCFNIKELESPIETLKTFLSDNS